MKNVLLKSIYSIALAFTIGCSGDDNSSANNELLFEFGMIE